MKKHLTKIGMEQPNASICINKSRLKVYNKEVSPTYYLKKGDEFQIEIFNPTSDTILAKIYLNGKTISQGGLVIRPGERVFLERYLDIPNKFLFDTYEVSNTDEVKKAIEDNGDFKVEFFKESQPTYTYIKSNTTYIGDYNPWTMTQTSSRPTTIYGSGSAYVGSGNIYADGLDINTNTYTYTVNSFNQTSTVNSSNTLRASLSSENSTKSIKNKTIETGRIEAGGISNQEIKTVNKSFDYYPFHTVEYKMLPLSQKISTINEIKIRKYCSNCGKKAIKTDNFCSKCGKKI